MIEVSARGSKIITNVPIPQTFNTQGAKMYRIKVEINILQ